MRWFRRTALPNKVPAQEQWQRIQTQVRSSKQQRIMQTAMQRDLVDDVSQILFRADPIGINFETNTDEYDAEAETIVIALPSAHGPEDVEALAHETFVQWFDAQIAGPSERYRNLASEIWNLWHEYQERLGPDSQ